MRLYRTGTGLWVGTQADARDAAGRDWEQVVVPDDKEGLITFLNDLRGCEEIVIEGKPGPIEISPAPQLAQAPRADRALSLTDVEEYIQAAGHPQLARVTENAIYRMRELMGRVPS